LNTSADPTVGYLQLSERKMANAPQMSGEGGGGHTWS